MSSAVAQAQEVIADRDDSTKQYCCEGPTCKCCGDGGATCDARGCICR